MFSLPVPNSTNVAPLAKNDVHIWLINVADISQQQLLRLQTLLSKQELQRNGAYQFDKHRLRDTICRALVRLVLSDFLCQSSASLQFECNQYGKPRLTEPNSQLQFNLSHSGDYIACAITLGAPIGIDIETNQRSNDVMEIADHYFSKIEMADLLAYPERDQRVNFFDYWTLKESYIKARGLGLAIPLNQFSFLLRHKNAVSITFGETIDDSADSWTFLQWRLDTHYHLALAVQQRNPIANTYFHTELPDF